MLTQFFENRLLDRWRRRGRRYSVADGAAVWQSSGAQTRQGLIALQFPAEFADLRFQPGYLVVEGPRTVGNRVRFFSKPRHEGSRISDAGGTPTAQPKRPAPPRLTARSGPGQAGKVHQSYAPQGRMSEARRRSGCWRCRLGRYRTARGI